MLSNNFNQDSSNTVQPPFKAADHLNDQKVHLLLAASGSVATIKIPNILRALSSHENLSIILLFTKSASAFLQGQSKEQPSLPFSSPNLLATFFDEDEWNIPWTRSNPILHIELRRWAHIMVIAPLSANTLAKITGGFSDNLLTSVVRAWDTTGSFEAKELPQSRRKRIVVAPAMNTSMWRHPITKKQIGVLEDEWGVEKSEDGWFEVLRPMEKELACGDVGTGAMKEWSDIVVVIEVRLGLGPSEEV